MSAKGDALYRYTVMSEEAAEKILENVLMRRRWDVATRDKLAEKLRDFADKRHAELTAKRREPK